MRKFFSFYPKFQCSTDMSLTPISNTYHCPLFFQSLGQNLIMFCFYYISFSGYLLYMANGTSCHIAGNGKFLFEIHFKKGKKKR